ncbi:type II secretion system protein [Citricoccus nitrophenolicus]|uniref:type II secretion system protein n=1 Tax=Citricoccus nitrophenolicus TaxID=863575 RepID=UPI0031EF23E4
MSTLNSLRAARHSEAGLTMMSVVVALAILSILGAIAIPTFTGGGSEAADQSVEADLHVLGHKVEVWKALNPGASVLPTAHFEGETDSVYGYFKTADDDTSIELVPLGSGEFLLVGANDGGAESSAGNGGLTYSSTQETIVRP